MEDSLKSSEESSIDKSSQGLSIDSKKDYNPKITVKPLSQEIWKPHYT